MKKSGSCKLASFRGHFYLTFHFFLDSVGFFFYQPKEYMATPVDVRILTPKFVLNKYTGLFFTAILKQEKFKFNYSRKMGTDRLKQLKIKLPTNKTGQPDFEYIEKYIKSLPYSSSI